MGFVFKEDIFGPPIPGTLSDLGACLECVRSLNSPLPVLM